MRLGLHLVQKVGLDVPMIKISRNKFLRDAIFKYGWHHEGYNEAKWGYDYLRSKMSESGRHICFRDKSILEIGAGNSIGLGYFFFNEGYRSWTASDVGRSPNETPRVARLEYQFAKRMAQEYGGDILEFVSFEDNKIHFRDKIIFRTIDITQHDVQLENKFDFIISTAVLEHVPREEMDRSIGNMARYLRDGGIMVHAIDLKDHVNPLNPFGFYKYDEEEWEKLTKGTIFYTNRLRTKDYLDLFEKNNLSVVYCERYKPLRLPDSIDSHFKQNYTDEDLQAGEVFLISQHEMGLTCPTE